MLCIWVSALETLFAATSKPWSSFEYNQKCPSHVPDLSRTKFERTINCLVRFSFLVCLFKISLGDDTFELIKFLNKLICIRSVPLQEFGDSLMYSGNFRRIVSLIISSRIDLGSSIGTNRVFPRCWLYWRHQASL